MARRNKLKETAVTLEEPVVHAAVLVERPAKSASVRRAEQIEALDGIKGKVFGDALRVVEDHLRFRDVDPGKDRDRDPAFQAMVEELGFEQAEKAYRLASAGWMAAADAPVGIKNAMNMAIGIMKANAAEKGGSHILNVSKIVIDSSAVPQFEEVDVES